MPRHDATTPCDAVYIATCTPFDTAREYLADIYSGLRGDTYRHDIASGLLEEVTADDWRDIWTQGDHVHTSETDAINHAGRDPRAHVLRVTTSDVRAALEQAFGSGAA